jgi:hypothetical protein
MYVRRTSALLLVALLPTFILVSPVSATTVEVWGPSMSVPGLNTLNTAGPGIVNSISCKSVGNCSAAGTYGTDSGAAAFVVDESNGVWGSVQTVTGLTNADGFAAIYSLSCGSVGNCSAGGMYGGLVADPADPTTFDDDYQAFVVNEVNGVWGDAIEVPGSAELNAQGQATIDSISCPAAGDCSAVGNYQANASANGGAPQDFVVNETNGVWGSAEEIPGIASMSYASLGNTYISCSSAGNCSAGGGLETLSNTWFAFLVNETDGVWGDAFEAPGLTGLSPGESSSIRSISCASEGECSAGGQYQFANNDTLPFVVDESNGIWGEAEPIPGLAQLDVGDNATFDSISCTSPGDCGAGGDYTGKAQQTYAYVTNETNGIWSSAIEVSIANLNSGDGAQLESVSCGSSGDCSAGGYYGAVSSGFVITNASPFVVNEVGGHWDATTPMTGVVTMNVGVAEVTSLSCVAPNFCAAGGRYADRVKPYRSQAFVMSASQFTETSFQARAVAVSPPPESRQTFEALGFPVGATGTVSFSLGQDVECRAKVVSDRAVCRSRYTLGAGSYQIDARFSGDKVFAPTTKAFTFVVS